MILSPILRASQFMFRFAFCSSSRLILLAAAMVEQKSPALIVYSEAGAVVGEVTGVIAPLLPPVRMTWFPWILYSVGFCTGVELGTRAGSVIR